MKFKITITLFILAICLASCYSYKIFPSENRQVNLLSERTLVYVENTELETEYKILKASGLFNFATDSIDINATHIRLKKIKKGFVCGNPLVGYIMLLGQFPAYLPDRSQFAFEMIKAGEIIQESFDLGVVTRYWFWDIFSKKNFTKTAGTSLAAQYYRKTEANKSIGVNASGQ